MATKYTIGVISMQVEGSTSDTLTDAVEAAGRQFAVLIEKMLPVEVRILTMAEQRFNPSRGAFAPLDFMEVAIIEKIERDLSFLIVVTEVELASKKKSYLMTMASQATNIGLVSTKRLQSDSNGDEVDSRVVTDRLIALLVRTFGQLLNLPIVDRPGNLLSPLADADELDQVNELTEQQIAHMVSTLPGEAFDRSTTTNKFSFVVATLFRQFGSIIRVAWAASPFKILSKMPTMLATALSVIVVMLFGAETWDFAAAVSPAQLLLFVAVAFSASTFLLYRAFSLPTVTSRRGALSESAVVTAAATLLSIMLALFTMFAVLAMTMYLGAEVIFPDALKQTWTTVEDALQMSAHISLSFFLATVGILTGSLGGAADNRSLVRSVLFVTEDD